MDSRMKAPANWNAKTWWSAMTSQMRDMAANDNMTTAERRQSAMAMQEWARERAQQPEWRATAMAAMQQAQRTMSQLRPRR